MQIIDDENVNIDVNVDLKTDVRKPIYQGNAD